MNYVRLFIGDGTYGSLKVAVHFKEPFKRPIFHIFYITMKDCYFQMMNSEMSVRYYLGYSELLVSGKSCCPVTTYVFFNQFFQTFSGR